MPTKEEILNAVKLVRNFAGNPVTGVVATLLKDLESSAAAQEVRTLEAEETR